VLLTKVVGWDLAATPVRLVQTVLWLFVVNAALSFLNAIIFASAKQGTWQAKMPRLFVVMARVLIVLMCLAIVLSTVWETGFGSSGGCARRRFVGHRSGGSGTRR
jgi:hypothetical protein